MAVQLREHHIEVAEDGLAESLRGVIEVPGRGLLLGMWQATRCIGIAYVSLVWTLEHGGHSAWLEEFYLDPEFRGQGLGTRFLLAIEAACLADGCAAVDLEIDADHERVRSLYERHGYSALPRRRMSKVLA